MANPGDSRQQGRRGEAQIREPEREVRAQIRLDGRGALSGHSGHAELDRMLGAAARHGYFDLSVECVADPVFDLHLTCEKLGECVGRALSEAIGDRDGVARIGSQVAPLEEALVRVVADLSGRPHLAWRVPRMKAEGTDPLSPFRFLKGLVSGGAFTVHVDLLAPGRTAHVMQAVFRALGGALRQAVEPRPQGPPPADPGGAIL